MEETHLKIEVSSRFFSHGQLNDSTKYCWIVCHGYGQLAQYFIQKFTHLDIRDHFILAPEGMNKFYLQGFSGRVGASWMTKDDRENAISNYCVQLNAIYENILARRNEKTKIVFFGFSQGTATISRWMAKEQRVCDQLVLWGGRIAKEIAPKQLNPLFNHGQVVFGKKDEFYSEEIVEAYRQKIAEEGFLFQAINYDGGHSVDSNTLEEIIRNFDQ